MPTTELATLRAARNRTILPLQKLDSPTAELRSIDEQICDMKDAIRGDEGNGDVCPHFIESARPVYQTNDRRAAVKRRINERLGA
jgi:hypothetical protein